jgi:hypothetical protein
MLSVADDLLSLTWHNWHQKWKVRRSKVSCLPGFLGRIFWYFGWIIRVPEETAKDLVEQGFTSLCIGANYWLDISYQGQIIYLLEFSLDQGVQLSILGMNYWADYCPQARLSAPDIWGGLLPPGQIICPGYLDQIFSGGGLSTPT